MQRKQGVVWGKCAKLTLPHWTQSNSLNSMSFFCCCCCYNLKQQSLRWTSIIKAGFLQSSVLPHFPLMFKFLYHEPVNKTPILPGNNDFLSLFSGLTWTQWLLMVFFILSLSYASSAQKTSHTRIASSHWVHLQNWKGLWLIVKSFWFSRRWVTQLAEFKCHWHTH